MKLLSQTGLSELISKIKAWGAATFLDKTDVEQTTTIGVDSAPTSGSTNLVTSGGVYSALGVRGVQVAGTDLTPDGDGKVDIPVATKNSLGVVRAASGIGINNAGQIYIENMSQSFIDNRQNNMAVTPYILDYAVKSAMCDGIGSAWTAAEQKAARDRLGVLTPTAADAGKVPIANDQGGYTLGEKADKPAIVTSGTAITLADNTEYKLSNVTALDISFPASGSYSCWMTITTDATTAPTISFPASALFVGTKPSFGTGETWKIFVEDGVIVAGKAVSAS